MVYDAINELVWHTSSGDGHAHAGAPDHVVAHYHVAKVAHFVSSKNAQKFFADKISLVKNIRMFFIFLGKDLGAEEKITREYRKSRQAFLTIFLYKSYKNNKCSPVFLTILVNTFPPKLHHLSILILVERLPMHKNLYL